jgi:hypothetical protein
MFIVVVLLLHTVIALPFIPGYNFIGGGYDAVKDEQTAAQLFTFTKHLNKTWTNPFYPDLRYTVPDTVSLMEDMRAETRKATFMSAQDYTSYRSSEIGISFDFAGFGFSDKTQWVTSKIKDESSFVQMTKESVSLYSLYVSPFMNCSSEFWTNVHKLPAVYDQNTYQSFVDIYGTHFVQSATLGGSAAIFSATHSSYAENGTSYTASANAQLLFQSKLKANLNGLFSKSTYTQDWYTKSSFRFDVVPASPDPSSANWTKWVQFVKKNPQPVEGRFQLTPIGSILPEGTIRDNFNKYVQFYANQHAPSPTRIVLPPTALSLCSPTLNNVPNFPTGVPVPALLGSAVYDGLQNDYLTAPSVVASICHSFGNSFSAPATFNATEEVKPTEVEEANPLAESNSGAPKVLRRPKADANPVLPGMDHIGRGMNAIDGKMRMVQVLDLTYTKKNTWSNPYNNKAYLYPDQVAVQGKSENIRKTYISNSTKILSEKFAERAGISVNFPFEGVLFGLSADVQKHFSVFEESQSILYNDRIEVIQYLAEIEVIDPPLSQEFIALQKKLLAPGYDEDRFRRFVDLVGTHVVKKSSFGGKMDHDVVIENYYSAVASSSEIDANINIQWSEFQFGAGTNGTNSQTYKDFQKRNFASVSFLGGNYEWAQPDITNYNLWYKSIADSPAMLFFEGLVDISEFIADATIKQNLQKFLTSYYARAAKIIPSSKTTLKFEYEPIISPSPTCTKGTGIFAGFPYLDGNNYWEWDTDYDSPKMPWSCVFDKSGVYKVEVGTERYSAPMMEGCGNGIPTRIWHSSDGYFVTNTDDDSVECGGLVLLPIQGNFQGTPVQLNRQ